jgi:primosomal protein N' (replication factor Y)
MRAASVVIDIPVVALDTPYTYLIEDKDLSTADLTLKVGCAVLVPFGRGKKHEIGFVVDVFDISQNDATSLKSVEKVLTESFFSADQVAFARYLSKSCVAPLATCIRLFVPSGAAPKIVHSSAGREHFQKPSVSAIFETWVTLKDFNFTPRKSAITQKRILDLLKDAQKHTLKFSDFTANISSASGAIAALERQNVVEKHQTRAFRINSLPAFETSQSQGQNLELTHAQKLAVSAISSARALGDGRVVLVDGVTGSGKTEVYLRAIVEVIAEGKSAIVLVPEISLTPQTVGRFKARFGDTVAVLHSKMSAGERYDMWDFIKSGQARVVVGARSALFAPINSLGLIIIDEEHESTYKQESAPRYHARDAAIWLAKRVGATVVLGSATPSLEAVYASSGSDWTRVLLPDRANGAPMPKIKIVDMSLEFRDGERSMFSKPLMSAINEEIEKQNKIVLLLNQRGFANFLLCRDCGFTPKCIHCSTSLTFHEKTNTLICHHCGYTVSAPSTCPACGSHYLRRFGAGTERVERELATLIDVPIIRMDADTTGTKGAHARLLERFSSHGGAAVLLGTQMIAKGLDIPDVTLVGVINADTQLNLPDFRSAERTFNLISQVAGRAGRAHKTGRVIVQTYNADSPAIALAATYNRERFHKAELEMREALKLPPYVTMSNIVLSSPDSEKLDSTADCVYKALKLAASKFNGEDATCDSSDCLVVQKSLFDINLNEDNAEGDRDAKNAYIEVFPPCECVISRKHNNFRKHVLIKSEKDFDISGFLENFRRETKIASRVNIAIDINPYDLL